MPRYAPNKGKKRCPICRGFFHKKGIDTHLKFCGENHPIAAAFLGRSPRHVRNKPRASKPKTTKTKERFIVLSSIEDLEWFSYANSLKEAGDQASEILDNDGHERNIAVFKVVGEFTVSESKIAHLSLKTKK